jgi:ABC-2 type transport system ATP-binding protein
MSSVTARVSLHDAGKRYTKYEDTPTFVGRAIQLGKRTKKSALWAIRHVDLEIPEGETIGIIGRNGSGKSTLLSLMAGVTAPSEGRVRVRGRVAPLISVGVGFHPELTGRENVFVNGAILGVPRDELERRFDSIIDFAEIPDFIDTPVKFYSSGMFVRLGFSVAIAAEPDVLLVDEVLAVGDLAFQTKCFERMRELKESGMTIVAVSHNLNAVRVLCERSVVVHDGGVRFIGRTDDALSTYHELLAAGSHDDADAGTAVELRAFRLLGPDGEPTAHVRSSDEVVLEFIAEFRADVPDAVIGFLVTSETGIVVYSDNTLRDGLRGFSSGDKVRMALECRADLPTGSYTARGVVHWGKLRPGSPVATTPPINFYVVGRDWVGGVADLHGRFVFADN